MPFTRPTLQQISDRTKTDLEDKLTDSAPVLRRSVIAVIARVIAGVSHVLHGHLDWLIKQLFPQLSDEEWLLRTGSLYNLPRNPATFAQREVEFTGAIGAVIPAGAELQRSDGVLYTVDVGGTFTSGTLTLAVTAVEPGANGNVETGVLLTLVEPITSVQSEAEVLSTGAVDGVDIEDLELYRARLLQRIANTPQGGTAADHIGWALAVPGVTRAWVYAEDDYLGPGTVGLAFVRDGDTPSIIPDAGEVAQVQDYIDARRPLTENFTAFAPNTAPLNPTIDLLGVDNVDVRAAVQAELEDLLFREASPGGIILLSHIQEAISIAAGEFDHVLVSPVADFNPGAGNLTVLGTITWV